MKHLKIKKVISLVLSILMITSVAGISTISAAEETDTYKITVSTAGSNGTTKNSLSFKLYGTDGTSTDWVTKTCGKSKGTSSFSFESNYIGTEIEKVEIKVNGTNGWFPDYISVTSEKGKIDQTFYGGRWLDNNETLTFKTTDNVFKISIDTADVYLAGTDCDVHMALVDENGKKVTFKNLHDIHPKSNAFERNDTMSAYIACPDNFGKLQYVELWTDLVTGADATAKWKIERVTAEQVSGKYTDDSFSVKLDMWLPPYETVATIGRESGKTGIFKVSIKTGDKFGAGTDSFMYCKINGTKNSNLLMNMSAYTSESKLFERNCTNTGVLPFQLNNYKEGIGKIESITINLDKKDGILNSANNWYLEYVEIEEILPDGVEGQKVHIDVKKWFDSDEEKTLYI